MSPPPEHPWYVDGLAFQCQQCGACCGGEPGFVWVSPEEMGPLSTALGLDRATFQARHLRSVDGRLCLHERPDHDCALLNAVARTCQVYPQRPAQCRSWPWWQENLWSPATWRACAAVCPGVGCGPIVPLSAILEALRLAPPPLSPPPHQRVDLLRKT